MSFGFLFFTSRLTNRKCKDINNLHSTFNIRFFLSTKIVHSAQIKYSVWVSQTVDHVFTIPLRETSHQSICASVGPSAVMGVLSMILHLSVALSSICLLGSFSILTIFYLQVFILALYIILVRREE